MDGRRTTARGFTLIELLIVVTVIVILMSLVFRLGGIGTSASATSQTVMKLQKLENCLSGYYAAFGSYPPVAVHGSRDIYTGLARMRGKSQGYRAQDPRPENRVPASTPLASMGENVFAACFSQPISMECPFGRSEVPDVDHYSSEMVRVGYDSYTTGPTGPNANQYSMDEWSWDKVRMFRFGVLSYLLPRYVFMTKAAADGDDTNGKFKYDECAQWTRNNPKLPADMHGDGSPYPAWAKVAKTIWGQAESSDDWGLFLDPSQWTCLRWIANLECDEMGDGQVIATDKDACRDPMFALPFGVRILPAPSYAETLETLGRGGTDATCYNADPKGSGEWYVLREFTVHDNWHRPILYYSPAPYQSYQLWSAGPNNATFPPWIDLKTLDKDNKATALAWLADDIVQLSN